MGFSGTENFNNADCTGYNASPRMPVSGGLFCDKQVPEREEKFSNMIPPSFLTGRNVRPKSKDKPRPCISSSKNKNTCKRCKCKDKSTNTCDLCKKACDLTEEGCPKRIAPSNVQCTPKASNANIPSSMPEPSVAVPQIPGYGLMVDDYSTLMTGKNQDTGTAHIPAAGLPSTVGPQFDPCTGIERTSPAQPPSAPQYSYPAIPLPSLTPCYFYPAFPCCFNHGDASGSTTSVPQPRNQVKKKKNSNPNDQNNDLPCSNAKGNHEQASEPGSKPKAPKENTCLPGCKHKRKKNKELDMINCTNASPELIERICNSLQGLRSPDRCFLLLPITMPPRSAELTDSIPSDVNQQPSNGKSKEKTVLLDLRNHDGDSKSMQINKPQSDDSDCSDMAEMPNNNNKNNTTDNAFNNCYSSRCNPGCCYRPHCAYYFNPLTSCNYHCNNCRCCNVSCNKSCNACPFIAHAQYVNTKPNCRETRGTPDATNSGTAERIVAGAVTPFQPEVHELYERWLGFNQYAANNVSWIPPRSPAYYAPIYYPSRQFPCRTMKKRHMARGYRMPL